MKKSILPILFILLLASSSWGQGIVRGQHGGVLGAGGCTPPAAYWSTSLEGTVACATVFTNAYGTTDCDDATHPSDGTEDAKFTAGAASGGRRQLAADQDTLWIEFAIWINTASPAAGAQYFLIDDSASANIVSIKTHLSGTIRFSVYKFVAAAAWYDSDVVANGNALRYFRLYITRSDAAGAIKLWYSTDGTSYTLKVDQSGIDTSLGASYRYLSFGRNAGSNLPEDWYFDNLKVYTADPCW